jgi:hypothetical protein
MLPFHWATPSLQKNHELPNVAQLSKMAQSGHPVVGYFLLSLFTQTIADLKSTDC